MFRRDKMAQYMKLALFIAKNFSKDPRTQVGAIVLNGSDFSPHSYGYNGMPRGCDDNDEKRKVAPEKYYWFSHAERNAIDNAAKIGIPLKDCWIVVTMIPCMECARSIVQTGIKGVVTLKPTPDLIQRWGEHFERTESLLKECGVELVLLETEELGERHIQLF